MANEPTAAPNALTRITINLTRRTVADLDWLTTTTGNNRTDTINRAIALARLIAELGDGRSLRVVMADGSIERIHLI